MSHDEHARPLDEFESQLAALRPAPSGVDREALLFAAGRAAGMREVIGERKSALHRTAAWFWPLATAASLLVALIFARQAWQNGGEPATTRVEAVPAVEHSPAPHIDHTAALAMSSPPAENYLRWRQIALSEGIDALPHRPVGGDETSTPNLRAFRFKLPEGEG